MAIITNGVKKLVKEMQDAENAADTATMIDKAYDLYKIMKAIESELEPIKERIRAIAKEAKTKDVKGLEHKAQVIANDTTFIDPRELQKVLKKEGISDKFYALVKVQVTDTKKLLGDLSVEKICTIIPGTPKVLFK